MLLLFSEVMCQNETVRAEIGEAPKPDATTVLSFWKSVGARPKSSTPARIWSNIVCRKGKSGSKFKAPTLTPPPEVSLRNSARKQIDTLLIGDSITQHVRMAKTENLTFAYTMVRELVEILLTILSTHPECMRIIFHKGSFDILWKKTGSEILKKDFSLLETRVNRVSISGKKYNLCVKPRNN